MVNKVNLDAHIPREDFEVEDKLSQNVGRNTATIKLEDLKKGAFFFNAIRKPDFQRETNEWNSEKIVGLIESYINGDLIPAIILWNNIGSYTFVIDGSHRLSALAAWVNDDYGDKQISKDFYEGIIPEDQIKVAEKTRLLIRKRVGSYADYQLALTSPEKVKPDIVQKAKALGRLALQLQWVDGDATKAEESFFKINQEAAPINPTELILLKARKKPNGLAARAIMRSGTGHKYWSKFDIEKQSEIEKIAKEINEIFFIPPLKSPIKTLDLPIAGKLYSSQTLPLILNFINIVNGLTESNGKDIQEDLNGDITLNYLNNCKRIALRINSNDSGSLGLHPAVYLYSQDGRYKIVSFYAVTALMLNFDKNKALIDEFIKVRKLFEEILLEYDYFIPQIVRKYRRGTDSYLYVKEFYLEVIKKLLQNKLKEDVISEILKEPTFNYLTKQIENNDNNTKDFSREVKSAVFIKEALSNAIKCKICSGYIHQNSISIDHKTRKQDGGMGTINNAQITHPYCNTTYKN